MSNAERVLSYLENSLSENEKVSFERELSENSNLQSELNFQTELIEAIQITRKNELKSLLNNVPVTGTFQSSQYFKWGSVIASAVIIAGLGYFYQDQMAINSENENSDVVKQEVISDLINEDTSVELPEISIPLDEPTIEEPTQQMSESISKAKSTSKTKVNPPVISIPKGVDSDNQSEEVVYETVEDDGYSFNSSAPLQVKIDRENGNYQFHYQFKHDELSLFGDFDEPYELLDLQYQGKRILYLYYKSKYYNVNTTQTKVAPLEELSNPDVINQLNLIRTK